MNAKYEKKTHREALSPGVLSDRREAWRECCISVTSSLKLKQSTYKNKNTSRITWRKRGRGRVGSGKGFPSLSRTSIFHLPSSRFTLTTQARTPIDYHHK